MLALITLLILSTVVLGDKFWATPTIEWITVLCHMNYFSIVNFTNPFMDSVQPFENDKIPDNV